MPRSIFFLAALVAALATGAPAQACGDKFLVVGRGMKYSQLRGSGQPLAVLILKNADPKVNAAVMDPELQRRLKQAGHKVAVAEDYAQLDQLLKAGSIDLVLADLTEAGKVGDLLKSAAAKAVVMPVVYAGSKAEIDRAKQAFRCVFSVPGKAGQLLDVIGEARMACRR